MVVLEKLRKKLPGKTQILLMNGKKKNLEELKRRMSGWQLDAFLKSYDNKIKEGLSLFKKSLK